MPRLLLLDNNILSKVLRPEVVDNKPIAEVISRLQENLQFRVYVPEIVDYELRRKLLHLGHYRPQARKWAREALSRLDRWVSMGYIPLTTKSMRLAADIWAQTRANGQLRGPEDDLDVDVILAAQARQAGGYILTTNERHFRSIADVFDWKAFNEIS
jgi:predicted nucleic acid-binding protein